MSQKNLSMGRFSGIVNGVDVQALPNLPQRTQAFVVADRMNYIQVTSSDIGFQFMLMEASLKGIEITVVYDEDDAKNVTSIEGINFNVEYLFNLAKKIADRKHVEIEKSEQDGKITRIRVLDR
jgi:hypothetical protein